MDYRRIVGLDIGERVNKTCASFDLYPGMAAWDSGAMTVTKFYANPVDALSDPDLAGARVILENTAISFNHEMRAAFLAAARNLNIELYPISPRHTKNRRLDHGVSKSEKNDAWTLNQIGKEGKIPSAPFAPLKHLSNEPLVALRQVGYDVNHPHILAIVPELVESIQKIQNGGVPVCAVTCGAAKAYKRKPPLWRTDDYQFLTSAVGAITVRNAIEPSYTKLKTKLRERGIYNSNAKYHRLRGKSPEQRKLILKAEDQLGRFCLDMLLGRPSKLPRVEWQERQKKSLKKKK